MGFFGELIGDVIDDIFDGSDDEKAPVLTPQEEAVKIENDRKKTEIALLKKEQEDKQANIQMVIYGAIGIMGTVILLYTLKQLKIV